MGCACRLLSLRRLSRRDRCRFFFAGRLTACLTRRPTERSTSWKELAQDGYIFVIQNLRGRFKSEGVFKLSSYVDLSDPKATNETTDAYDSIGWLVKNVQTTTARSACMAFPTMG